MHEIFTGSDLHVPAIDSIPLLLAADIWQVVFGIIVFVLYSIGQLISAREQAKKKPAQQRQPRRLQVPEGQEPAMLGPERQGPERQRLERPRLERQGQPAVGQGNQEETLRREVEDFLRRAQGKPARQEQPARQQTPNRPTAEQPFAERSRASTEPLPSESARSTSNIRREGVAEHVASHLSSKKMIEHAEHLGDDLGLTDERMESRLQEKFGHQLGSLGQEKKSTTVKPRKLSAAAEVIKLLRKPGGMRQIIIAQEILRRPEW